MSSWRYISPLTDALRSFRSDILAPRKLSTKMSNDVKNHPDSKTTEIGLENAEAEYAIELNKLGKDADQNVPVSPFKDLPRSKAIWVFKKAVLYAVLVAWAALMDGFLISSESGGAPDILNQLTEISVPGSIVANKYFIAQFCTVTEANGNCALDSVYVGAWTAVQSVGQIIGEYLPVVYSSSN